LKTQRPLLATAEEIRTIAGRAQALLDAVLDSETPYGDEAAEARHDAEFRAAKEAMRFCSMAAALLGDASLVPVVIDAIDAQERLDDEADDDLTATAKGLTWLLRAGAPVDDDIEELAAHTDERLRLAVASGLRPRNDASIDLLSRLCEDADPDVRKAARTALSSAREVHWWKGKFQRDPLEGLTAEEAARHKSAFERISELLDAPRYALFGHEAELCALAATLPDGLAVDLLSTTLSVTDFRETRLPAVGAAMVARPGGAEALCRLCEIWGKTRTFFITAEHVRMVADVPEPRRMEACMTLARWALARPESERAEIFHNPGKIAAEIVARAFPPSADPTELFERMLAMPEPPAQGRDYVFSGLHDAFKAPLSIPEVLLGRLFEARLAGYPGPFRRLGQAIDAMLERAPRAALRRAAEEALRREDEPTVKWGLERLLFDVRTEEEDRAPLELVRRFLDDPRYRTLLLNMSTLRPTVTPLLRASLRQGELSFQDAAIAMEAIDALWGGLAVPAVFRTDAGNREKALGQMRDRYAAFLGPAELAGRPTPGEWRALREARARADMDDPDELARAIRLLPEGPIGDEDMPLVKQALEKMKEGRTALHMAMPIALSAHPSNETLAMMDEIAKDPEINLPFTEVCRVELRRALGLPAVEASEDNALEQPREWMDEDEDE
jgi:hypothetical protein